MAKLSCLEEAIRLTRKTLDDHGFEKVMVIPGTGVQSTRETKKFCVDAFKAGAAYALVLTPSTRPLQMTKRECSPVSLGDENFIR